MDSNEYIKILLDNESGANIAIVKYDKKHCNLYAVTSFNCGKNEAIKPWMWHKNDTPFGGDVNNGWTMYLSLKNIDAMEVQNAFRVLMDNACFVYIDTVSFKGLETNGLPLIEENTSTGYSCEYDDVKLAFGFYDEYWNI